jgi:hypothetical protein
VPPTPPSAGPSPGPDAVPAATKALLAELTALRHRAGSPSSQRLAVKIGKRRINPGTIDEAFRARISWDKLQLIVAALGGDVDAMHNLWLADDPGPAPPRTAVDAPVEPPADPMGEVFRGLFRPRVPPPEVDLRSVASRIREYLEANGGRFQGLPLPAPPEEPPPLPLPSRPLTVPFQDDPDRRHAPIGPASYSSLLGMSVEAAIQNIMTYHPLLAREWGWRS